MVYSKIFASTPKGGCKIAKSIKTKQKHKQVKNKYDRYVFTLLFNMRRYACTS